MKTSTAPTSGRGSLRPRARVSNAGPREGFFECVFAPARNEYRFQVRAWNAKEAEEHLRASLRDNGVREAGALLVRNRNGVEVLRSGFYGPIE